MFSIESGEGLGLLPDLCLPNLLEHPSEDVEGSEEDEQDEVDGS